MNLFSILIRLHHVLKIYRTTFQHVLTSGDDERIINYNETYSTPSEIYTFFEKYKLLLLLEASDVSKLDKIQSIYNSSG